MLRFSHRYPHQQTLAAGGIRGAPGVVAGSGGGLGGSLGWEEGADEAAVFFKNFLRICFWIWKMP